MIFGLIGKIKRPKELSNFNKLEDGGIADLLNVAITVLIIAAGIYALFNFIFAGYGFMSAAGDPKKIESAWAKIWQTMLGLTIAAGAIVLAAIIGQLVFGNPNYILSPVIPTP